MVWPHRSSLPSVAQYHTWVKTKEREKERECVCVCVCVNLIIVLSDVLFLGVSLTSKEHQHYKAGFVGVPRMDQGKH